MSTIATVHHTSHAGELERYTFTERIMHWTTGLTYLYCLSTGLAFTPRISIGSRTCWAARPRRAFGIPSSASGL